MFQKIKIAFFSILSIGSILFLFLFGLPYESVEATAIKWLALAYPDTSTIAGLVFYQESATSSSTSLEGVDVVLFEVESNQFSVVDTTQTNSSGSFQFTDLEIGTYYLGYYGLTPAGNYAYQFHNGKETLDTADPIIISTAASQVDIPAVTFNGPVEQIIEVLNTGGAAVYVDPDTGQIYINKPRGNVSFGIENKCTPTNFASIELQYSNLSSYTMTLDETSNRYIGTIPLADMTLPSAEIFVDYTCTTRETSVVESLGQITQYDPLGNITSQLTNSALADVTVKLYQVDGATPDTGTAATGDCRTVNSRPNAGSWEGIAAATVDQTEFLVRNDIVANGIADPPINPQVTTSLGVYGWDLDEGCYYVELSASGYQTIFGPTFGVLSGAEITDLDFQMIPANIMHAPIISVTRP